MKRGESRWERERREQRKWERGERKLASVISKILLLFLQYCYSTIPKVELYCSSIAKIFTIPTFRALALENASVKSMGNLEF